MQRTAIDSPRRGNFFLELEGHNMSPPLPSIERPNPNIGTIPRKFTHEPLSPPEPDGHPVPLQPALYQLFVTALPFL
jgi:hypothetical protein